MPLTSRSMEVDTSEIFDFFYFLIPKRFKNVLKNKGGLYGYKQFLKIANELINEYILK